MHECRLLSLESHRCAKSANLNANVEVPQPPEKVNVGAHRISLRSDRAAFS
jgi:hypothetical protein